MYKLLNLLVNHIKSEVVIYITATIVLIAFFVTTTCLIVCDNYLTNLSHFMQTDQGIKNIPVDEAGRLAGSNPDYSIQDLYEAIATGNFVRSDTIFFINVF